MVFLSGYPIFRQTDRGHLIEGKIKNHLQPDKELKLAQRNYNISPTIEAALRLAGALVDKDEYQAAERYYLECLNGHNQDSPDILLKYARAKYLQKNYTGCKEMLDYLCEKISISARRMIIYFMHKL